MRVPRRRGREGTHISKGTDRVTFDFFRQLPEHVDLTLVSATLDHAIHHLLEVSRSLSAGSALSATELRTSPRQYTYLSQNGQRILTTRACRTVSGEMSVRVLVRTRGTATHLGESGNGSDNVGRLVHDDDGTSTESRLQVLEGVKVHPARQCQYRSSCSRTRSTHKASLDWSWVNARTEDPPADRDGISNGRGRRDAGTHQE